MKIYLLRHGQTTGDIEDRFGGDYDDHLTEEGQAQAKKLAQKLEGKGIEVIFSSPRIRAQETAQILSESLNLDISTLENIRERNFYGPLTGMIKAEAREKYPDLVDGLKARTGTIAGAEPYADFKERVLNTIDELSNTGYQTIAIVTHGGPISCFFREVLKTEINGLADCAIIELTTNGLKYNLISSDGVNL